MEKLLQPVNLLWITILLHLIADFNLQGILADMKQKSFWEKASKRYNVDFQRYQYDWVAGLLAHSLMWSIFTFWPLMLLNSQETMCYVILINAAIHAAVDHLKANKLFYNLCADQLIHILQIVWTLALVGGLIR